MEREKDKPVRAILAGAASGDGMIHASDDTGAVQDEIYASRSVAPETGVSSALRELKGLTDTLGLETAGIVLLTRMEATPQYGIGTGKASEISALAREKDADCIIFDFEISPTQQRNWEKLAGIPVFDRQEVILRIFAQRARTKEAVLQVELARLNYSLPRLAHSYGDMARQRGGSYGSKGAGETQLELDRRGIMVKIANIKKELEKVVRERSTQRKRRDKVPVPSCALVGYTNAGKSSLLNALTGSGVFVENKLFATLDPTTRRLDFPGGGGILLTDTVGFISNLPHTLVDAFRATLEEAARADLVLLVLDASDTRFEEQYRTTIEVLEEIGAGTHRRIVVLNKMDMLDNPFLEERLKSSFPDAVRVSAKTGDGFAELTGIMRLLLIGDVKLYVLPTDRGDLESLARRTGEVVESIWDADGIHLKARVHGKTEALLSPYLSGLPDHQD